MNKIVKIGLVVISIISFVLLFTMPDGDMPMDQAMESGGISAMFIIAYLLLAIAVIATLVFGLKNVVSTPGGLKKAGIGVIGLLIALGLAYGISSGTDISPETMLEKNGIVTSEGEIKAVGAGINMFAILLLAAVGLIAWGGIKKSMGK